MHEKRVKRWRRAYKRDEIEKANPHWRDLWFDLASSPTSRNGYD